MKEKACILDITDGEKSKRSRVFQHMSSKKYVNENIVATWNQENLISTGTYVAQDKGEKIVYSRLRPSRQQTKQYYLNLQKDIKLRLQDLVERLLPLNILEACEYLFRKLREQYQDREILVATSRAIFGMEAITTQHCVNIELQMKCYLNDDSVAIILIF